MQDELFPTEFACSLGEACGLMEEHGESMDFEKYIQRNMMMKNFQQMAMDNDFKDCLIIFHSVNLKKAHKKALKIIHKYTAPFVIGDNTAIMNGKLRSPLVSGRDAKEIYVAINEHCGKGEKVDKENALNSPRGLTVIVSPPPA